MLLYWKSFLVLQFMPAAKIPCDDKKKQCELYFPNIMGEVKNL